MQKNSKKKNALKIGELSFNCYLPCPLALSSSRRSTWAILWMTGLKYSVMPLMSLLAFNINHWSNDRVSIEHQDKIYFHFMRNIHDSAHLLSSKTRKTLQ